MVTQLKLVGKSQVGFPHRSAIRRGRFDEVIGPMQLMLEADVQIREQQIVL